MVYFIRQIRGVYGLGNHSSVLNMIPASLIPTPPLGVPSFSTLLQLIFHYPCWGLVLAWSSAPVSANLTLQQLFHSYKYEAFNAFQHTLNSHNSSLILCSSLISLGTQIA